jgi:hypothetical protein
LTSIRCIGKENKEAKESQSETHRQEATHNHDPSVHQYTHAGRQEDKRKTTQKSKQAWYFIKAMYLQRVQSSLTISRQNINEFITSKEKETTKKY